MIYRVKRGDTLSAIAAKHNTTVQAIKAANPSLIKDVNVIRVGWEILIPTPAVESFQQLFLQVVEKVEAMPEFKKLVGML